MQDCARMAFDLAKDMDQMSVVVDADGLWLVQVSSLLRLLIQNDPKVVLDWPGVPRVVLTPNVMEFQRLCEKMVRLELPC